MCVEPVTSLTPTDAPKATTRSHDATASTLADMGVSRLQSSDALVPEHALLGDKAHRQ